MRLCAEAARRAGAKVRYGSLAGPFHLPQRPVKVARARVRFPAIGAARGQYPPVGLVSRSLRSS